MFTLKPKQRIFLGTDTATGERLYLSADWLSTHLHLLGPTNSGKSRLLLWLFQHLAQIPKSTVVLINPKGELYRMARDWAITHGLTQRVVLFDPGESELVIGYNPLRPNGMPIATHAKAVREGIRSSWGQNSFDQTPQLARFLYLALCAARERELTLIEAVNLLRAGSALRDAIIPVIQDPYVQEALAYFDSLREARQEELAASTLARLEAFVCDPTIRHILTQRARSLDLAHIVAGHKILLVNLEQYRPMRPDDVKLLGRLLINDLLAHVFERPVHERTPVYVILDEVQTFATEDLCMALEQGRELGLCCVLAHQHLGQLLREDGSGRLLESVMNNARTKILFGGSWVKDLRDLTEELLLDQYSPWTIKAELDTLELEPVETTRVSRTKSRSGSLSTGLAMPMSTSTSESVAESRGRSASRAYGNQVSRSRADTHGRNSGRSLAVGTSTNKLEGFGKTEAQSRAWQYPLTGPPIGYTDSAARARHTQQTTGRTDSVMRGVQESESESATVGAAHGESFAVEEGENESTTRQRGTTSTSGIAPSIGGEIGWSESETTQPFHEYVKRQRVSSRTFLTEQEFLTLGLQKIKAQPRGHFVLKVPSHPALYVRAPWVETPRITTKVLATARQRIFAQPYYSRVEEIEAEERTRTKLLTDARSDLPDFNPDDVWNEDGN